MKSNELLEWIKTVGGLIISWPVVGILALIIFRKPLIGILAQFSNSDLSNRTGSMKVKVGLIEMERDITSLTERVEEQKMEQEKQRQEIETLQFLISNFVTNAELTHLEKLGRDEPFHYDMAPYFELELRRLRSFRLIENYPGKGLRSMPASGNLKDYFFITDKGKEYLQLRKTK